MEMSAYLNYLLLILIIGIAGADYHCRRNGFPCKNDGFCNRNGTCTCPATHSGFDCSIDTSLVNCETNPCQNGGICYDEDKCSCSPDFYGDRCQYQTVSSECMGSEIQMTFVAPKTFAGTVYVGNDEANCKFNKDDDEVPGLDKYALTIPFNSNDSCSKAINITNDTPMKGDIRRVVDVVVSYNPIFISSTDSIIIYSCVHKGANFSMFAELDDVGLDERTNLKKDVSTATYMPVRFVVLEEDGQPLNKPLFVGDNFKLLFFLSDTSVYETLRIDHCVANNTIGQNPISFEFVKDGCPTNEGKSILVNSDGPVPTQYTRPGESEPRPASELPMIAFKFKSTTNVGFNCAVRMCKKGEEQYCTRRDCSGTRIIPNEATTTGSPTETTIRSVAVEAVSPTITESVAAVDVGVSNSTNITEPVVRRRRASNYGDRQFLSTILTVQEPSLDEVLILPKNQQGNLRKGILGDIKHNRHSEDDSNRRECVMSQDIVIILIVMATMIFVLVVISVVLSVSTFRGRRQLRILKEKQIWNNYTIPRPKLNEKGAYN